MAEYIAREALMKNFCGYDLTKCVKYGNKDANQQHDSYSTMMMYEIASEIEDAPAADVAPVRHGRWLSWDELHGGNTLAKNVLGVFCSECIRQSDSKTRFCHNCGARMDKEALECDT